MAHPTLQKAFAISKASGRQSAVAFLKHELTDAAEVSPEMAEGIASDALDGKEDILLQILELAQQLAGDSPVNDPAAGLSSPDPLPEPDGLSPLGDDEAQQMVDEGSAAPDTSTQGPATGEEPPVGSDSDLDHPADRLGEDAAPLDSEPLGDESLEGEPLDDEKAFKSTPSLAGDSTAHDPGGPRSAPPPGRPTSGDGVVVGQLERAPKESEAQPSPDHPNGPSAGVCAMCSKVHPGIKCSVQKSSEKWTGRLEKANVASGPIRQAPPPGPEAIGGIKTPKPLPAGQIAANVLLGRKQTPQQRRDDPSRGGLAGAASRALSTGIGGAGRQAPLQGAKAPHPGFPSDSSQNRASRGGKRKAADDHHDDADGCGCGGPCCTEASSQKWLGRLEKMYGGAGNATRSEAVPSMGNGHAHGADLGKREGYDFGGIHPATPTEAIPATARGNYAFNQAKEHQRSEHPVVDHVRAGEAGMRGFARERGLAPEFRMQGRIPGKKPMDLLTAAFGSDQSVGIEPLDEDAALSRFSQEHLTRAAKAAEAVAISKATLGQKLPAGSDSSISYDKQKQMAPMPPKPAAPSERKAERDEARLEKTVSALRDLAAAKKSLGLHGTQRSVLGRIMGLKALRDIQKSES